MKKCPLCNAEDETVVFKSRQWRVIRVKDKNYPAYFRVIVNDHYEELTDLPEALSQELMQAVLEVEKSLRTHLNPKKINVASLGNQVSHVHWHVIARFENDAHFPGSIWDKQVREVPQKQLDDWKKQVDAMAGKLSHALFKLSTQ